MEFGISSKNNYSLITIEDGNTIGICGSGRGFKWTGEYDDTKIISKEEWIKHIEKLNISTVTTWIWLIERYFPNETEIRSEFCKVEDNLKNEIGLMIDDMEKSGFLSEKTIRKQLKNYL